MTHEEYLAEIGELEAGTLAEVRLSTDSLPAAILGVRASREEGCFWAHLRSAGDRAAGSRNPDQLRRLPPAADRVTGNIYADFLDERGFHEAAEVLREAFPIEGGEG